MVNKSSILEELETERSKAKESGNLEEYLKLVEENEEELWKIFLDKELQEKNRSKVGLHLEKLYRESKIEELRGNKDYESATPERKRLMELREFKREEIKRYGEKYGDPVENLGKLLEGFNIKTEDWKKL